MLTALTTASVWVYQTVAQQKGPGADGNLSIASFIASVAADLHLTSDKTTA